MTDFKAILILVIEIIVVSSLTPIFFTQPNILNVLRQVCVSTIIAVGFACVMGSGHMDLSVGSVLGMTGIVMAKLMTETGLPLWLCLVLATLFGISTGALNAALINHALPFFIVTLATKQMWRGFCYISTNMVAVMNLPKEFVYIGQGTLLGIPVPIYIMLSMVTLVWFVVNRTAFGRYVIAMGGNSEAARVSGINVKMIRLGAYCMMGFCVSVASMVTTARAASAQISAGIDMEMDAIAAVVIGGTPMGGGYANVIGSLIGCVIVGILNNALNLLKVDSNWQIVAKGLLILFAIVMDRVSGKWFNFVTKKRDNKRAA
jgi:ribose/xylose/arabinose/galactoside ABC-type transport system permease subunit